MILLFPHLRSCIDKSILEAIQLHPHLCWIYADDTFFIWEHREDCFKQFIEKLNVFNRTIKFTVEWARENNFFFDVKVRLGNRELKSNLHIKPTDTDRFIDSTSCHQYLCQKMAP